MSECSLVSTTLQKIKVAGSWNPSRQTSFLMQWVFMDDSAMWVLTCSLKWYISGRAIGRPVNTGAWCGGAPPWRTCTPPWLLPPRGGSGRKQAVGTERAPHATGKTLQRAWWHRHGVLLGDFGGGRLWAGAEGALCTDSKMLSVNSLSLMSKVYFFFSCLFHLRYTNLRVASFYLFNYSSFQHLFFTFQPAIMQISQGPCRWISASLNWMKI